MSINRWRNAFGPPLLALMLLACGNASAQDLEPRRWSHLPVGLNVFAIGTGWATGDIFFDPVLLIEDASFDVYAVGAAFVHAFDLAGRSARVDINVPYATGHWEGLVDGEYASVRRSGFRDPSLRFSVNLIGAPALGGSEFLRFRQENPVNTTVGAALAVTLPVGDYLENRLINLGDNRVVLRPQLGVLHQRRKLQLELTGSVFLYGDNDKFWGGNLHEQDPLWFAQAHAIYAFKPRWWFSVSGGYAHGGRSRINGVPKPNDSRTRYLAFSLGMTLNAQQSLKFTFVTSDTNIDVGNGSNALLAAWSMNWGGH